VARQARLVDPGIAFHVTARGNYQQTVFFDDDDRAQYLHLLSRHAASESLEILGWCLMTNHVHLLAVPQQRASLARSLMRTQSDYAQRLNRRHSLRRGHLWQSRFYSCPVEGDAVWTVLRYIELNPLRAGLIDRAERSQWSTAAIHCGLQEEPPLLSMNLWNQSWTPLRWKSVLAHGAEEREIEAIRQATQQGVPFGSQQFVADFERRAGRSLLARPRGRPRALPASSPAAYPAGDMLPD
jgi:putative transposase